MADFSSGFMAPMQAYEPNVKVINGSIKLGIQEAYASYTWPIAAGADVVVTADTAGTAGNALDFQATADGLAAASLDFGAAGLTNLDTVIEFATGGTAGNDWVVTVAAGSGLGEGVNINEDTTNKVLTVMFEDAVSTVSDFETAIGTTTNFTVGTGGTGVSVLGAGTDELYEESMSGGTAQEWAEESGTPLKMHLHYTDGATTGTEAKTAINAVTGKSMTATGGDANSCASGDAVAKQDLSGGVSDTAPGATITGLGFSVTQTVEGTYTITFDRVLGELLHFKPILSLATAADMQCLTGAYSATNRTITVWTVNDSGAADDPASVAAGDAINFKAVFQTSGV